MIEIETEMAESEAIPTIVMQVATKTGMADVVITTDTMPCHWAFYFQGSG